MLTSVWIGADAVRAVTGKTKGGVLEIGAWRSEPLPPECVAGGVLVNEEPVRAALTALKEKMPDAAQGVRVVIDSGGVLVRKATAPKLPDKKLRQLVQSEFVSMAQGRGELVYDYMTLGGAGAAQELLCAAAEKGLLESYIAVFAGAGLRVRGINAAAGALANLAGIDLLLDKTCIVCVADGSMLDAALFVDGRFAFYNTTRLLAARGGYDSFAEIGRTLSSLIQFNASQHNGRQVSAVYFGGLTPEEAAPGALLSLVEGSYAVSAQAFGVSAQIKGAFGDAGAFPAAQYLFCVGDLYEGGRRA
ncbi:MAG: pilus assembly protein PilM [Oscillospiraceae bacterium]|nr:pilus assembly protein PilM [Oscillospiraceae bacterium]